MCVTPLLAKLAANSDGIVESNRYTTYGHLGERFPRDRFGDIDFAAALGRPCRYDMRTYERVVMLMTGGFAD